MQAIQKLFTLPHFIAVKRCSLLLLVSLSACTPGSNPPAQTRSLLAQVRMVQQMPAYHKAQKLCTQQHYRKAAQALQALHTSCANPVQSAFLAAQQQVCLNHLTTTPTTTPQAVLPATTPDCGPRALAIALAKMGRTISPHRIDQMVKITPQGVSLLQMQRAARKLGLHAQGVQANAYAFAHLPTPALLLVDNCHYIVLLALQGGAGQGSATVQDPNQSSPLKLSQQEVLRRCAGIALLLRESGG